jgi:hypothetical protein
VRQGVRSWFFDKGRPHLRLDDVCCRSVRILQEQILDWSLLLDHVELWAVGRREVLLWARQSRSLFSGIRIGGSIGGCH